MKGKNITTLAPEYLKDFKCIGSLCEDTCCSGWKVSIDKETFRKYRKNKHPDLKDLLKLNITRNRQNPSDSNYGKIQMDKKGACTLLDKQGLCKIHSLLGEEMLSSTCSTFPRIINKVNDTVEKSLTLACPEAARLVLMNSKGIDFIEEKTTESSSFFTNALNTQKENSYFWELRIFCIQMLQKQSFPIETRMVILGLFLQKLSNIPQEEWNVKLPSLMQTYLKLFNDKEYIYSLQQIPSNIVFQVNLAQSLIDHRIRKGITNERYIECIRDMIVGLGLDENLDLKEIIKNYEESKIKYYSPFMDENEYILENYLVNYIFKNLFPNNQNNIFNDFLILVINILLIRLTLVGMAKKYNGLTKELVIKLIQSFTKTVDHNASYLRDIEKILTDSGYTTMAHMTILLKS